MSSPNRREFIKAASATAFALRTGSAIAATPKRPNILIIFADQLSLDALRSPARRGFIHTPNLDALGAASMSFTRAYASNPLCVPSRTSMFTGRYPVETGIESNEKVPRLDPTAFPCMGSIFRQAGYQTAYFGKWHLPYPPADLASHGFEQVEAKVVDTETADQVVQFLGKSHDAPFLAIASFLNPHNICEWARGDALDQGNIGVPPPATDCPPLRANHADQQDEPDIMTLMRRSYQSAPMFPVGEWNDDKWRQYEWAYYRLIERMDAQVGRVMKSLHDANIAEDTVVLFLADHGDCQGAHHWNQKTVFYEESVKVPFLLSYPRSIKPGSSDQLVNTGVDLIPTLCDFAGIAQPPHSRGMSLRPVAVKASAKLDRTFIVASNHLAQGAPIDGILHSPHGRMLCSERYKYCVYSEGQHRESLVDLVNDPGEMQNLAGNAKYQHILQTHRAMLQQWGSERNDHFPYSANA
jgi:arylsulfatase A-like enzyme